MNPQYDSALLGILQHEGKLEKFLDVIFGFLMRRTDFFYIMTPEQKKLGFPNGVSIQMVLKAYEKYKTIFEGYQHLREESPTNLPTKNQEAAYRKDLSESGTTRLPSDGNGSTCENALEVKNPVPETEAQDNDVPSVYQADADSYNGATRDNYTWSQSVKDIDIKIKTPESVINARDVSVNVERKRIRISIRQNGQETPYFDRNLCWDIHRDNAVWTFHPKENQIHLCLDKVQERWWEAAFDGEAKINTRKIDCSQAMHELDDEAQAKIHQLMYDEQCKRQGLPTSAQEKIQNILADAWDKEGSPFRGTNYDPTKVKLDKSSVHIEI